MSIFKCKMCGGNLEVTPGLSVAECQYCGTKQTLPKLEDDRRAQMYDRANHFRRNNEYDKAMGIYEKILNEDDSDAEAYWSLVLCRYGIEYVEDPATHRRVPTVNRTQFTSIFDDEDYKSALKYADGYQKSVYEEEANTINEIQKGILAISQKEEPFDVFICYKETDQSGKRTRDSVLANDLYHQLTQEGFKVFFSRITLEDKLGSAYEPYIFAALNSAKVMVVIGTKPEYFNAVWVKNEWSRYLSLIKNGAQKTLIPAYRDMDPYDLPEEFSHLQAQDMSKLGFMQDLIRGIKKITQSDEQPAATVVKETIVANTGGSTAPLLKRAFMFLEDGDFARADDLCEQVLNQDPENAQAYLGKLMANHKVCKQEQLKNCEKTFDGENEYQKILRFGDDNLKKTLNGYIEHINTRKEKERLDNIYTRATNTMNSIDIEDPNYENAYKENVYKEAAQIFESIREYKDSAALIEKCSELAEIARKDEILNRAKAKMSGFNISHYENAIKLFQTIPGWKDADEQITACQRKIEELKRKGEQRAKRNKKIAMIATPIVCAMVVFIILLNTVIIPNSKYDAAVKLTEEGNYDEAVTAFNELGDYKDSADRAKQARYDKAVKLAEEGRYDEAAIAFGRLGSYKDAKAQSKMLWEEIAVRETVSAGDNHTVGLRTDGTVVAVGDNDEGQCDVEVWTDIVAVSAGRLHTVGLKSDGAVVAVGDNDAGQCNVEEWTDIVAVSAGYSHTVGLKADGTVVAVGYNEDGRCDVEGWTDIAAISTGVRHTIGLRSNGTVVVVGDNEFGQCNVENWTDIVAVSAGNFHTVGLKSDGVNAKVKM